MSVHLFFKTGFLAMGIIFLSACENDPAEIDAMVRDTREVEVARNIEAIFSQSGNLRAILEAPLMYRVKADTIYTEFPDSVYVTFYKENGDIENVVRANYARYFELLRKVYLRDSVVVFSMTGDTIFARDMWWDQTQEIFYSDKPVRVYRGMDRLNGDGIRATQDFKKTTIINPKGPVAIPPEVNPGPPL